MEGLAFVVVELILAAIGWACLLVRYGRIDRVQKILDEKYAGSAAAAARIFILNVFAGTGAGGDDYRCDLCHCLLDY